MLILLLSYIYILNLDVDDPEMACGEESGCINRAVLIECANDCPCGKYCRNKR